MTVDKTIKLNVNGRELTFNMSLGIYNRYINELQPSSKVGPAQNLCTRSVADESKAALQELLQLPGMAVQIASKLFEDYTPDIEIEVGK
ncbi:putative phage tail assembly chaperone [Nitratidesulfovibrio sp. HK-II]|uniref:putative phage tail assembly chaperone n=1 Tax=Nitratidesulfovibrio sp. HK-II TaxID=2009266 RepID=UPI000E2E4BFC|nr:putative phage tail assembly chaperone [Nitratidesulfovibrio sp. HK-II]